MSDVRGMCHALIWGCILVSAMNLIDMLIPPPIISLNIVIAISVMLLVLLGVIDIEYLS